MDKILETIGSLQQKRESGSGGVIGTLVLVVLSLIAIAALMYSAWKDSKELAKLRHERDVEKEAAHRAAQRVVIAEHEDVRAELVADANEKLDVVEKLQEDIHDLAAEHAKNVAIIKKLKTWDDINEYLESGNSSSRTKLPTNHR